MGVMRSALRLSVAASMVARFRVAARAALGSIIAWAIQGPQVSFLVAFGAGKKGILYLCPLSSAWNEMNFDALPSPELNPLG